MNVATVKTVGNAVVCFWIVAATIGTTAGGPLEGFGSGTRGGADGRVVHVTTLADAGPGSLRYAVAGGHRRIVFDIAGTIQLARLLAIKASNLTIDGATAPPPGITIRGKPFAIQDAHDIIVRHLRLRDSSDDNLRISGAARNIVIDHCSSTSAADGAIDITQDYKTGAVPSDITVCWSLLAGTNKAMLASLVRRLSLHHNVFIGNAQRNPQLHGAEQFDFRNNIVWHWGIYGVRVRAGATGNIVANVFGPSSNRSKRPELALVVAAEAEPAKKPVQVFVQGNLGPGGFQPDRLSTTDRPFQAPAVEMIPPQRLRSVLAEQAGAQPTDPIDRQLLIQLK